MTEFLNKQSPELKIYLTANKMRLQQESKTVDWFRVFAASHDWQV